MRKKDIEESQRAMSQLSQSMATLDQLQNGLLGQTGDLTRQMADMFDLLDQRGLQAEQLVATLTAAISLLSRLTRDMASLSDAGFELDQTDMRSLGAARGRPQSTSVSSPLSPSQSQLRHFFSQAVRRGFGGL
jgi:hypothetical protein